MSSSPTSVPGTGYASTGPRKKPSFPWSPFTTSLTATGACFPTLRPASASKEDARYRGFPEKAAPYLERGTTAQELAQALALPVDLVRLYLLRLERLGVLRREAQKGAAPLLFGKGGAA